MRGLSVTALMVVALVLAFALGGCAPAPIEGARLQGVGTVVHGPDGRPSVVYEVRTVGASGGRIMVVYVGDDRYRSALDDAQWLIGFCEIDGTLLIAERPGVNLDESVDREEAAKRSRKGDRVGAALGAVDSAVARWPTDGPLVLIGVGEGGHVAARVARLRSRVTHLVLIGVGGGWTPEEEVRELVRRGESDLADDVAELDAALAGVDAEPDSLERWGRHPYRRWASYLPESPRADVLGLPIPVLLIHGDRDRSVPVESARSLAGAASERGLDTVRYVELRGVSRTGRSADGSAGVVLTQLAKWLRQTGALSAREASVVSGEDARDR